MLWLFLVIGQIMTRQLMTSSENLVINVQCLVALATSNSQFSALPLQLGMFSVIIVALQVVRKFLAKWTEGYLKLCGQQIDTCI